jgi:hypothetical protein
MEYSPYQDSYYQPRRKSVPEVLIEHILISVVSVFIIVLGFLMVAMSMSTIDDNTSVPYKTYDSTFDATGLGLPTDTIYPANPLLTSITITRRGSVNGTWCSYASSYYTYDDDHGAIILTTAPLVGFDALRVQATVDVATAPYETFFSTLGIGLIIGSIMVMFGIVGYAYYKNG